MELPTRKRNRLIGYDYRTPNAYFITICTDKRKAILWNCEKERISCRQDIQLSECGISVDRMIQRIPEHYPAISVDHYVIMPNHIHLLLQINSDSDGRPMVAPTISTVVQQLKGAVSKRAGFSIWQKGFHDHVIRGEKDYTKIWNYIEDNPAKWMEDCFYVVLENEL